MNPMQKNRQRILQAQQETIKRLEEAMQPKGPDFKMKRFTNVQSKIKNDVIDSKEDIKPAIGERPHTFQGATSEERKNKVHAAIYRQSISTAPQGFQKQKSQNNILQKAGLVTLQTQQQKSTQILRNQSQGATAEKQGLNRQLLDTLNTFNKINQKKDNKPRQLPPIPKKNELNKENDKKVNNLSQDPIDKASEIRRSMGQLKQVKQEAFIINEEQAKIVNQQLKQERKGQKQVTIIDPREKKEENKYDRKHEEQNGKKLMDEQERLNTLNALLENKKTIQGMIAKMPLESGRMERQKKELNDKLVEIERGIVIMSKKQVYIV